MTRIKTAAPDNVSGVPAKRKKLATHALYCDPSKVMIPAHSPFGRMIRKIVTHLSESFLEKPSPFAQTMVDGLAVNIIMAKFFQASFLRGDKMAPSVLRDYTGLWNSISRDLATLSALSKEGAKDPAPSLGEYLEAIKSGKLQPVESESVTVEPENNSGKTTGKNSLF
jgi:hypothetical protein